MGLEVVGRSPACRGVWHWLDQFVMSLESSLAHLLFVAEEFASASSLSSVNASIVRLLERLSSGPRFAVLLYDPKRRQLSLSAAPSLDLSFATANAVLPIGESGGLVGMAASALKLAVMRDGDRFNLAQPVSSTLHPTEFPGGWAVPVIGASGDLLGVIGAYSRTLRNPSPTEREIINTGASLVHAAIVRGNDAHSIDADRDSVAELSQELPDPVIVHRNGRILYLNHAAMGLLGVNAAINQAGRSLGDVMGAPAAASLLVLRVGFKSLKFDTQGGTSISLCVDAVPIRFQGISATLVIGSVGERPASDDAIATGAGKGLKTGSNARFEQEFSSSLVGHSMLLRARARALEPDDEPSASAFDAAGTNLLVAVSNLQSAMRWSDADLDLDDGLAIALSSLAIRIDRRLPIGASFLTTSTSDTVIPSEIGTCVLEIADRATALSLRRRNLSQVIITLVVRVDGVELTIFDDGDQADASESLAVTTAQLRLKDRAELSGGGLETRSEPTIGNTLILLLPFDSSGQTRRIRSNVAAPVDRDENAGGQSVH